MKKFLAILLMVVLVLSMSVVAFADEGTGTITVTNATHGQTYKLYKLFGARPNGEFVSYSMEKTDAFYSAFFKADGSPVAGNIYFTYDVDTKEVKKVKNADDTALMAYVQSVVQTGSYAAAKSVVADDNEIIFSGLDYGYYVIDNITVGGAVTITSNTTNVKVIDKNQNPLVGGIEKKIWNADEQAWADENTAFVGDIVKYRVTFNTTNYAGMDQIRYYTVHDSKGSALWVEFGNADHPENDIVVKVGEETLQRGYYHLANQNIKEDVSEWEFLGNWTDEEKDAQRTNMNVADWYLIHYDYDVFEIVIPWMENHTFVGNDAGFEITYPSGAASKFSSTAQVELNYVASVESNAYTGSTENLMNSAYAKWTGFHGNRTTETDTVYTHVEGLAIHKLDASTHDSLAGATFQLFKDEACTQPLYVLPTFVEGVYVYDDLNAPGQVVSGEHKNTARLTYAALLDEYLQGLTQKNEIVTPANGKIVITGLKGGTYYIKETQAPAGYNVLTKAVSVEAGHTSNRFYIYANDEGKVANIQAATPIFKEVEFLVVEAEVFNSRGQLLPSTGGMGTFWLITIGTLLAIGFAVFLITHKKMSVYTD